MKNIIFALLIVLAAIGACNPPQSTTGTESDSATNTNRVDTTTTQRDTTVRDTTMRDTTMRDTTMRQ
jgi:hypothetical protein